MIALVKRDDVYDEITEYVNDSDAERIMKYLKVVNAIEIPEGATNGDMVKALFSKTPRGTSLSVSSDGGMQFEIAPGWWDSPYESR